MSFEWSDIYRNPANCFYKFRWAIFKSNYTIKTISPYNTMKFIFVRNHAKLVHSAIFVQFLFQSNGARKWKCVLFLVKILTKSTKTIINTCSNLTISPKNVIYWQQFCYCLIVNRINKKPKKQTKTQIIIIKKKLLFYHVLSGLFRNTFYFISIIIIIIIIHIAVLFFILHCSLSVITLRYLVNEAQRRKKWNVTHSDMIL